MKFLIYTGIVLVLLFIASQIWAQSQTKNIEMYPFEVMQQYDGFEIRKYEAANFIYVTMDAKNYKESSSEGFGQLAGYIFGGNDAKRKIAMTSPVEMEMEDNVTMKFLVPAEYDLNEMPRPDNANVQFKSEAPRTMAAISFGGFADDEKIEKYKNKLFAMLAEQGIEHKENYSFMGYNPPFELINRKNEIVVEIVLN
ncbi:MAG: heme-binding protein [Flavobacteriales bacterium]|nr:heme-binding protein [Flavobacteriales bacterium]